MPHIKQKNSSFEEGKAYTVVIVPDGMPLEEHDSIVEHPELFEIVDADIPEDAQFLKYSG